MCAQCVHVVEVTAWGVAEPGVGCAAGWGAAACILIGCVRCMNSINALPHCVETGRGRLHAVLNPSPGLP